MKKIVCLFLAMALITSFTACSSETNALSSGTPSKALSSEAVSSENEASSDTSSVQTSSVSPEDQKLLKNISVTYEPDSLYNENGKQRMIINFENTGKKIFSGYISVTFVGDSGILGNDVFPVNNFKPGHKGHGNLYIVPDDNPVFTYKISDYSFSDDSTNSDESENEDTEISKKLTKYMYENFGGCGQKEFATSWYPYIEKIKVYKNADTQYSIVSVSTTDEKIVKNIGDAIFGNTTNNTGADGIKLDEVIVKDDSGKELFRRSK